MKNTPLTTPFPAISEFAIFESRPGVGIVLLPDAPKFTIVAVSNDFLQTSGMTRDQVIGKSLFEVFPESPGDPNFTGEQNIKDSFAYIIHFKVPHEIPVQRYDIPNGDGTFLQRYWRASNAPVLNNTGEVLYIIHTATDITDQVLLAEAKTAHLNLQTAYDQLNASEENFRLLVDTIRQSIWITDAEGQVEYLNKHWCDYCGEAFSPTTATDISIKHLHPEDGPKVMQAFGKAMQTGEPFEVEQRNRSKEGEYRWFLNRATPYKDPVTGKIIKWFGVGIDIHDRKLAEEALRHSEEALEKKVEERTLELEKANQDLKRSNANLEEFAYAASHDMKEPIRKIHFFAERLKGRLEHKMEEEDRRYFERLEAGAKRMNALIDDLLLYSHVNRGMASVETVNLNQMLSFVLDDLELQIDEKKAMVEIGALPTIQGRPRQMQQLFENLIANALKYSKEGVPPVISVSSRLIKGSDVLVHVPSVHADSMYHLMEVRDNGIGFEQADAERIFNVFTRLHGNTEYRGTGVGLSIAQKIVENHKGHIWAESTPGEGATFKVVLPIE